MTATVPNYDVPALHAVQDAISAAFRADGVVMKALAADGVSGTLLYRAARLAALAVTPVPPLTCPRCQVGRVWSVDEGSACSDDEGGQGCGAAWDSVGVPS